MPKLRNPNDSVLSQYLYCSKRNNKPRIHHLICEERCKKFKGCPYYKEWYAEYYGKELEKEVKPKRKKVIRRTRKKVEKKNIKQRW